MIFAPELYCACTKTVEVDGLSPAELSGDGLWVGVLSRGVCALQGCERPGRSGDILLGGGPLTLTPQTDCHRHRRHLHGHFPGCRRCHRRGLRPRHSINGTFRGS